MGPAPSSSKPGSSPTIAAIEYIEGLVCITLDETDERLPRLLTLLDEQKLDPLVDRRDVFTDEELDQARLIIMRVNHDFEIDGGVKWGTTHDLSQGCPACGTGSPQTSALFIDGEELPRLEGHRAASTYHWHIIVDERLAADLENCGATGLYFRSVYAVMPDKRQVKTRWKQMCAEPMLPPMSPQSTGLVRERPCSVCMRNGYAPTQKLPTRLVYRASDLVHAADVNMTFEWFGFAVLEPDLRESMLSHPWILITPKVQRVFRDAGVTEFDWLPIRVEG